MIRNKTSHIYFNMKHWEKMQKFRLSNLQIMYIPHKKSNKIRRLISILTWIIKIKFLYLFTIKAICVSITKCPCYSHDQSDSDIWLQNLVGFRIHHRQHAYCIKWKRLNYKIFHRYRYTSPVHIFQWRYVCLAILYIIWCGVCDVHHKIFLFVRSFICESFLAGSKIQHINVQYVM